MHKKIKVKQATQLIGSYNWEKEVPYWSSHKIAVKVTSPCKYCSKAVNYLRGGIFAGEKYHNQCWIDSGDAAKQQEAFSNSILGKLTPNQYQEKHGVAWNE